MKTWWNNLPMLGQAGIFVIGLIVVLWIALWISHSANQKARKAAKESKS